MKLIGPAYTKEIFFTARTNFSAQDALRMGLVNQVVPKDELESFTRDYALTMARNAPLTLRSAKASVDQLLQPPDKRDLAALDALIADCFNSQDYQEGVQGVHREAPPAVPGPLRRFGAERIPAKGRRDAVMYRNVLVAIGGSRGRMPR